MAKKKSNVPSVSILTITQLKRFECIKILADLINMQTYKNIIEWVIVEGSKDPEDAQKNLENIMELQKNKVVKFPIVYTEYKKCKLGELRNIGNNSCKGNIIVCMDDDDYYPKERISHAVEKLISSNANIAASSNMLMYDFFLQKLYKFYIEKPNHGTNATFAYKKEYLLTNKYDNNLDYGEEASFTKDFTEKMIQLDSEYTIIAASHNLNTYSKREMCTASSLNFNPLLKEHDVNINSYISDDIMNSYKNFFIQKADSKYDIVYFCGGLRPVKIDLKNMILGNYEHSIINLSSNWVKSGKKVAIYTDIDNDTVHNGVDYFSWKKFPFHEQFNIVILCTSNGLFCGLPFEIKAKEIWLDLYDMTFIDKEPEHIQNIYNKYKDSIKKIFLKNDYHKEIFKNSSDLEKCIIIPNGVRINNFPMNDEIIQRNNYRFCYSMSHDRGLKEILENIWPIIHKNEPRSELHIYNGSKYIQDENFKKHLAMLMTQPGVMYHGYQSDEIIIREKYMSNFEFCIKNQLGCCFDIDSISIKESLKIGCIPLLDNHPISKDIDGIHLDDKLTAVKILDLLKKKNEMNILREKNKLSPTLIDWETVSKMWLTYIPFSL